MQSLLNLMKSRRNVHTFSNRPVSKDTLRKIIEAAVSAPSGLGDTHIIVVDDPDLKHRIRVICEDMERNWLNSQPPSVREHILTQMKFDPGKDFMETAPYLLVVSTRPHDPEVPYAIEAAFLAAGFMLVMIEGLGLGSVTFKPGAAGDEDARKLGDLLGLPEGEKVQLILPVGYPEERAERKSEKGFFNVFRNHFGERLTF